MAEYCLRWNNHQPNLVTVFSELLTAESLVDVTLATDGHFIHAHKLVLSACSVYFKDLFGSNPCKHPIVFLKDIRIEDLKTVIDFIYRGEVNVSQERLQDVLKTAESLRIKGLADKPFSYDDYPSQRSGQHHSSSLSSQRSSLTDSRDQAQSVDTDDLGDASGNSPPATKKRKLAPPQDSTESIQDANHEGEEKPKVDSKDDSQKKSSTPAPVAEEATNRGSSLTIKEKVKEEKEGAKSDSRPEFKESRAANAMLLLQGSSSEGGGDEGGTASTVSTTNTRGEHPPSLISSHSQGRRRPGRPPNSTATSRIKTLNPFPRPVMPSPTPSRTDTEPYLFANCLIVRPRLKASDGSYVTIRTGTAENFLQAVEDVREGKMGFCKAGKIYGVNHATLQKFYKAMGYHNHNRSNNPNFNSPSPSDREENDGDLPEGAPRQQENNDHHRFSSYTAPRPLYQHFMTPRMEHSYRGEGSSSARSALSLCGASSSSVPLHKSCPTSSSASTSFIDSLTNKLDTYSSGKLLNYASLYCEAIGASEDTDKLPIAPPTPLPSSGTQSQDQPSTDIAEHAALDINHPIVLCNL